MKVFLGLVIWLIAAGSIVSAEEKNYLISEPIDLIKEGANKVLCMKNGNTLLFHMEVGKSIIVMVFDSLHKQIANQKYSGRQLDETLFMETALEGIFEINGEAVLFFDQEHLSKHGLVRLRFSGNNGILTEEKRIAESAMSKRTRFYVMNHKEQNNYAVLLFTDIPQFKDCKASVIYFNSSHVQVREIPLDMNRKNYDFANVVNAEAQPNGVCISLSMSTLVENGTTSTVRGNFGSSVDIYNHHLVIYYIPKDSSAALKQMVDLSTELLPFSTYYTYNAFAKSVNVLLLSYKEIMYRFGLAWMPSAVINHLLFKIDEDNSNLKSKFIKNNFVHEALGKQDTNRVFSGIPLAVTTNENGLSTMVMSSFSREMDTDPRTKGRYNSYLGDIGITQFDDDGNEIWGIALPRRQCYKSYKRYYYLGYLAKKGGSQLLFDDLPEENYSRQFFSANAYNRNRNIYLIYNDNDKNFNNSLKEPGDTVYSFENTNTVYYKINRKREITKNYLFGTPQPDVFCSSFIEGADFDEQRGLYAALVQYKKGKEVTLRMAWSHLE